MKLQQHPTPYQNQSMKLQQHPTFLSTGNAYRVVPENGLVSGAFCLSKRDALIHWLQKLAGELDDGKISAEHVIKGLQLEEIESEEL